MPTERRQLPERLQDNSKHSSSSLHIKLMLASLSVPFFPQSRRTAYLFAFTTMVVFFTSFYLFFTTTASCLALVIALVEQHNVHKARLKTYIIPLDLIGTPRRKKAQFYARHALNDWSVQQFYQDYLFYFNFTYFF